VFKNPDVLWLNTQVLHSAAALLLVAASDNCSMGILQSQDEASSLDVAVLLLHDYLQSTCPSCWSPFGEVLGLLYARRYPETVKSLTLLGVGTYSAVDWQAHYYVHRQVLSKEILTAMVYNLFGYQNKHTIKG